MRRFIIDDDGSNFLENLSDDVQGDVAQVVQELNPGITTVMVCSNAASCYWPTRAGVVYTRGAGFLRALQKGIDPLGVWLKALKAAGKETFITFRMNDVHNPTEGWNTPSIRRDNPDCIVGPDEVRAGNANWMSYCMDYTLAEVRTYVLKLIGEQIELYGSVIDGFQLDWMRFPRHLSGTLEEIREKRQIMTELVSSVRRMLDDTGRRVLLSVRVPSSPEGCERLGLDLGQWAALNLVDMIVTCPFLTTDWRISIDAFRTRLNQSKIPVYAGFDLAYGPQVHYPESLRGIASSLYDCKPDGLYLFNFPCWIERLAVRPYHWLTGLENPATAAAKPMVLSVNHKRSRVPGVDSPALIPVGIGAGEGVTLSVHVPALALPVWRVLVHCDCAGAITLAVNGQDASMQLAAESGSGPYRSEVFLEFVNHYRPKTLRSRPEDCRQFRVPASALKAGPNQFTFTNAGPGEARVERFNLNLW
jgi:hypothetical protein